MSTLAYLNSSIIQANLPHEPGLTPFLINFLGTHDNGADTNLSFTPSTYFPGYQAIRYANVFVTSIATTLGAHTTIAIADPVASFTLVAGAAGYVTDSKSLSDAVWFPTSRTMNLFTRVFTAGAGVNQALVGISIYGTLWQGDHLPTATRVTLDGVKSWRRVT